MDAQNSIDSLIAGIMQETLNAEASQDRSNIVKAACFVRSLQEKQITLKNLEEKQKMLEMEYKQL